MDVLSGILLVGGAAFMLLSAVGILRLPDIYIRLHALTKAGTFGVTGVILAVIVHFRNLEVLGPGLLVILFFLITFPVSGHLIGRAAHRIGIRGWERTRPDELAESPEAGGEDPGRPRPARGRDAGNGTVVP
jgi:multicomponent Na+:H+ antiporter subunit G